MLFIFSYDSVSCFDVVSDSCFLSDSQPSAKVCDSFSSMYNTLLVVAKRVEQSMFCT